MAIVQMADQIIKAKTRACRIWAVGSAARVPTQTQSIYHTSHALPD